MELIKRFEYRNVKMELAVGQFGMLYLSGRGITFPLGYDRRWETIFDTSDPDYNPRGDCFDFLKKVELYLRIIEKIRNGYEVFSGHSEAGLKSLLSESGGAIYFEYEGEILILPADRMQGKYGEWRFFYKDGLEVIKIER